MSDEVRRILHETERVRDEKMEPEILEGGSKRQWLGGPTPDGIFEAIWKLNEEVEKIERQVEVLETKVDELQADDYPNIATTQFIDKIVELVEDEIGEDDG